MLDEARLETPDTDFFKNARYIETKSIPELRSQLTADVEKRLKAGSDDPSFGADVQGVLSYLANEEDHDSEGRDQGYTKQSFSRTELVTATSMPELRRADYLLYRYRFNEYPRKRQTARMPIILAVEPTSVCNLRCTMCFQADERLRRNRKLMGFMNRELYEKIIYEAAEKGVGGIVLASRGEPLLHKEIADFVRIAKEAGIMDVKLNTNATKLTADKARALLRAGLDNLVFSVDSAEKHQFEKIRVGAKFEQVVANIRQFNEIRKTEFPDAPTRTRISMVLLDGDQDAEYAAKFWSELVDEFAVRWEIPRLGIYDKDDITGDRPCSLLWERLYIWWDGIVNTCDEDYLSKLQIGQLSLDSDETIEGLWSGDRMNFYREIHSAGKRRTINPCAQCPGL
ncbi:radical SAM/SPASM domain-containing protein [Streptomyces sp. NPDC051362]|uniref:radical SAM/SPASM domain-containing protein n=1 Tax=Streptomyces sp. NPDC051362 TaxID=3365651 RepID=UPI0037A9BE21